MEVVLECAFWLAAAVLVYAYAGFPALVAAVGLLRRDGAVDKRPVTPKLTLIIAAYNEQDTIAERVENALAADYPANALEIIVASDGSTDATEAIVGRYVSERVRLLRLPRVGKVAALEQAVRRARGEILVFSDADTIFGLGTLRALAANFADPRVGGVAGHPVYRAVAREGESSGNGERLYRRYDTWLKELESRSGSIVSALGSLYAIRREHWQRPADASMTDDFTISTTVIAHGKRLVFERDAHAWETAAPAAAREFRRRVRLMTRGWRAVAHRRALLNPFRFGFYAVVLFSHKVLRRLTPVALLALLLASVVLALPVDTRGTGRVDAGGLLAEGAVYPMAALGLTLFLVLSVLGGVLRRHPIGQWKLFYVPFFYTLANVAALVALLKFLRGDRIERWEPQRHTVATR